MLEHAFLPEKTTLSIIAILMTVAGFVPYLRGIWRGCVKPHVFSWLIWGMATLLVFFAQRHDHAGVGAWPTGVSALLTSTVALLAYRKHADVSINAKDWLFLCIALMALPAWFITQDPLLAVIIMTGVDIAGFGPTLRKAYHHPHSEALSFYVVLVLRNLMILLALENYSWTTILFPAAIALTCVCLVIVVLVRKRHLSHGIC